MAHINALELDRAKKNGWSAADFFYALKDTLTGAALEELVSLQTDLHQPDLAPLIPDWFECENRELMGILRNQMTFSGLSERTQLAIVIVHFFHRFQIDTPQTAMDDFLYSAQEPTESIRTWGDRLDRLVMKLDRFGIQISFDEYLEQWSTGTKDGLFSAKLDEAIEADDPNKLPVIYDFTSFRVWYARYLAKNLSKKKKLQRRSRLLAIHAMRKKAGAPKPKGDSGKKKGNPVAKPPPTERSHSGPAPAVTTNPHNTLFRPRPSIPMSEKTCFNCGKKGHIAKDCKQPRRPRRMVYQSWRSKIIPALAAELGFEAEQIPDEWSDKIMAFVASTHQQVEPQVPNRKQEHPEDTVPPEQAPEVLKAAPAVTEEAHTVQHVDADQVVDEDVRFRYGHHMLSSFQSTLSPSEMSPTTMKSLRKNREPTRPSSHDNLLIISDFADHNWPSNFSIWESHVCTLLKPWLHKCRLRGGHAQSDLTQSCLMNMVRAAAWLRLFLDSSLAVSLGELTALAHEAQDEHLGVSEVVQDRLDNLFQVVTEGEQIPRSQIYTSMLDHYRTMCEDKFGPKLLAAYQPEDDSASDPDEDSADQWHIPLPGEPGVVSLRSSGEETANMVKESGGMALHSSGVHRPVEGSDSTGLVEPPSERSSPDPLSKDTDLDARARELSDPKWVTTRPHTQYIYYIVRFWKDPPPSECHYAIWASKVSSNKAKGVKLLKTSNQLHVARNYVAQIAKKAGPAVEKRALQRLTVFDPDSKVPLQEVGSLRYVRDPDLTFDAWVGTLPARMASASMETVGNSVDGNPPGSASDGPAGVKDGAPVEAVADEGESVDSKLDEGKVDLIEASHQVNGEEPEEPLTTRTCLIRFIPKGVKLSSIADGRDDSSIYPGVQEPMFACDDVRGGSIGSHAVAGGHRFGTVPD